jgi:AraC-like DNA-binding protein
MRSPSSSVEKPGPVGELRRSVASTRTEPDHAHDAAEFMLVMSGTGRFFVGHQVYDLRPGTLIWQLTAQRHRLQRGPNLEMWVAQLHQDILDPQRRQDLADRPCRMVPPHELADIDRLLAQVAQDSDEISVYNAGLSYAVERLWRAGRSQPSLAPRSIHPAVARAILLLRRSGALASLEEIARQTGVAPSYLSRLVVAHTGRGFVDWRNRIRLEHFMDAYRPGANLLDLALESGFGSYSRFNHVFHDIVGCAPIAWVEHGGQVPPELAGHAMPEGAAATALSARSAWGELLPLVSAILRPLLGTGCLARVLQPGSVTRGAAAPHMRSLEAGLSAPQRSWLAKSLAEHEPAAAALLQQVLAQHDFASLHANVLEAYGLSSTNPCDALAASLALAWVGVNLGGDPGQAPVFALATQVRETMGPALAGMPWPQAQHVHTALLAHFVIGYHALQAARAHGAPRALDALGMSMRRAARVAFDGDLAACVLTDAGLRDAHTDGSREAPLGIGR